PQPLSLLRPSSLRREAGVLCQRFRDGRVEAAIQRVEFFYGNRRILIEGELGDCLADVAIVVDDLRHVEPQGKQVAAVAGGGRANRLRCKWGGGRFTTERLWQRPQGDVDSGFDFDC